MPGICPVHGSTLALAHDINIIKHYMAAPQAADNQYDFPFIRSSLTE